MKSTSAAVREEIVNAITHGIGAALSVAGLALLIVFAALKGNAWHIVSFSIFGATMVILYMASTLYHSFVGEKVKNLFRKLDHMSIYLLIAGTYTPFCLVALRGWIGWTFLGIVWGCTILGIVLKAYHTGKNETLSTILYILMGWMGMLAAKPLYDAVPLPGFLWLLAGGLFYTAGTYFFVKDKKIYFHGIWHLFVLAGTVSHFFAVMTLLSN